MDIYYIIFNDGFLKHYYSENTSKDSSGEKNYFADNLRYAKMFNSAEEAFNIILEKKLKDCVVTNQNGNVQ